ncbi:lasso RiPP family leader peptide-containing protein [Streptomyces sp. NPDC053048]
MDETRQIEQPQTVYEPPLLVEVGDFTDRTEGDGGWEWEGPLSYFDG